MNQPITLILLYIQLKTLTESILLGYEGRRDAAQPWRYAGKKGSSDVGFIH